MKKLLVVLCVLALVVGVVGLVAPTEYRLQRSVVIKAPPERVHALVGDLREWPKWAPWEESHTDLHTTYGDHTTGVGAHQSWTSADGDGELTLTRCDAQTGIAYDMAFVHDGHRTPASSALDYRVVDGATEVTWSMQGDWKGSVPPVLDGWMQLLTPWMIGDMFDQGLDKLRQVVEAGA